MEPINNINQLAHILRKQLAESQSKVGVSAKTPAETRTNAPPSRAGVPELQQKLREKLRGIDPDDPKATQKSIHVFLESILLWEFGERLMDDPKFYGLLDEVQLSMESDPAVRKDLESLVAMLR